MTVDGFNWGRHRDGRRDGGHRGISTGDVGLLSRGSGFGRGVKLGPVDHLGVGRAGGVDDQQAFVAPPQQAVDVDFPLADADDGAGARVRGFFLDAGAVAEDDDDFVLVVGADQGLQARDPVRHGDDDEIGFGLEDVEGELEGMPRRFELYSGPVGQLGETSTFSGYPTRTAQLYLKAVVRAQSEEMPEPEGSRKGEMSCNDLKL
ncbi:hypothetical protein Trco_003654 [Trichoderma cornu-damae]|uniref:Uncharacterized protein n=1 Tax=Trichoderma cornu-damae TaxID=654480 RepID=A0A9P8TTF6_9HYPO|nr:hypothetical protein Trco_003654 [Trichoderma cornu-damae]